MAHLQEAVEDYLSEAGLPIDRARRTVDCLLWLRGTFEGIVRGVADTDLAEYLKGPQQGTILASDIREVFFTEAGDPKPFTRWLGLAGEPPEELVAVERLADTPSEALADDLPVYRSMLESWLSHARPFFEKWVLRPDRIGHRSGELELLLDPPLDPERLGRLYPGNGAEDGPPAEEVQDAIERVKTFFDAKAGSMAELFHMPQFEEVRRPVPRPRLGGQAKLEESEPLAGPAGEAARLVRASFDPFFKGVETDAAQAVLDSDVSDSVDSRFTLDPSYPPHLKMLLRRLREGLDRMDPVGACLTLVETVDFLIRFFASVAAGGLEELSEESQQVSRQPETSECLEVLQRCHSALGEYRDDIIAATLLSAFHQDEAPGEHTRWLGLHGPVPEGFESFPNWERRVRQAIDQEDPEVCAEVLDSHLPLLAQWLRWSYTLLNSWDFHFSLRRDLNLAIRLARGGIAFEAYPFVDPERYGLRLSQDELDVAREDPRWQPSVARESGGVAGVQAPEPSPAMPPHLRVLLGRLSAAIDRDEVMATGREMLHCFDFLVRYYSSVATGALKSQAPFPLDSVLEESGSILHCTKLLHYSLFAFESYPDHPFRPLLNEVFFRQGEPLPHTRWLGLAGSPLAGLENLSGWRYMLERPDALQRIEELVPQIRMCNDLLHGWVRASENLFEQAAHSYDQGESEDLLAVVLELEGMRFRAVPDLYVGGYGFSLGHEQLRDASRGELQAAPVEVDVPGPKGHPGDELFEDDLELSELLPELSLLDSELDLEPVGELAQEPWLEPDEEPAEEIVFELPEDLESRLPPLEAEPQPASPPRPSQELWDEPEDEVVLPEPTSSELWPEDDRTSASAELWVDTDSEEDVSLPEPSSAELWEESEPEPASLELDDSLSALEALEAEVAADLARLGETVTSEERPAGWTQEQVDQLSRRCQALSFAGPESRPLRHSQRVARLVEELPGGYIAVTGERGYGKTLLSRTLTNPRSSPFHREFPVIHFSVGRRLEGDYGTFIEILNEHIKEQPSLQEVEFRGVDQKVVRDLNVRYPAEQRQGRFLAYLNALRIINRCGFLLILDGLDETEEEDQLTPADFLPGRLPEGVYLLCTARDGREGRVGAILERIVREGAPLLQLSPDDPDYHRLLLQHLEGVSWNEGDLNQVIKKSGGSLALLRLLRDGILSDYYGGPAELPSGDAIFGSLLDAVRARFPQPANLEQAFDFLALLAAYRRPLEVERLPELGIGSSCVQRLIDLFPSVFAFWAEDTAVIGLAHDWFRSEIVTRLPEHYRKASRRLTEVVLERLFNAQDVDGSLGRAFWWALDAADDELLERVAESSTLKEHRRAEAERLERAGKLHQKVDVLDGWCAVLGRLVNQLNMAHYREELAWAYSSRGLAYLLLGQFQRALVDIERATDLFSVLFEKEGQVELTNGLAAAHNRRSEAFMYLGDLTAALENADVAIQYYTDVVESLERTDLKNLLALAYLTRGNVRRRQGDLEGSSHDITTAIETYWPLVESEAQDRILQELATAHNVRGVVALMLGHGSRARDDSDRAIELLTRLVEHQHHEELRNELAGAYNNRAAASHRGNDPTSAIRDYDRSIELRRRLVEEGRLDLRADLAMTFTNRGLVLSTVGRNEEALGDYQQAIRLRTQLVDGEDRHDLRGQLAFAHLSRGATYRALGQPDAAIEDYTRAVDEYRLAMELADEAGTRLDLADAHSALGALHLGQGELERSIESCSQAIQLYERELEQHDEPEYRYHLAVAAFNHAEACRMLEALGNARDSYHRSIEQYEWLVTAGRDDLKLDLATVCRNRGGVELQIGLTREAVQSCTRAIVLLDGLRLRQADPASGGPNPELIRHLASAYALRGRAGWEAEDLGEAVSLYRSLVVDRGLGRYHHELAAAHRDRALVYIREEREQRGLDDLSHAIRHYSQALERPAASPEWKRELAHCLLIRSAQFLATNHLQAAVNDAVAAFDYGPVRLKTEELETLTGLIAALKAQGEQLVADGDFVKARSSSSRIIELCRAIAGCDPSQDLRDEEARAYLERGITLLHLEKPARAREEFSRAVDILAVLVSLEGASGLEEDLARAFDYRARACRAQEQTDLALVDLSRAIELYSAGDAQGAQPGLALTLLSRAEICRNRGEYALALMDLARTVPLLQSQESATGEVDQALASAHSSLGMVLHLLGRDDEATDQCDRAIRSYRDLLDEGPVGGRLRREAIECMLARATLGEPAAQDRSSMRCLVDAVRLIEQGLRQGEALMALFPDRMARSTLLVLEGCERPLVGAVADLLELMLSRGEDFPVEWLELLHPLLANLLLDEATSPEELGRLVGLMEEGGHRLARQEEPVSMPSLGRFFEELASAELPRDTGLRDRIQAMRRAWEAVPSHVLGMVGVYRDQLEAVGDL